MRIEKQLDQVRKFYHLREGEFYHSIDHVRKMLKIFYENESEINKYYPDLDKDILIDSILYHDAGYEPGNPKNEENATIIYMNVAEKSISQQHKINVVEAILGTIPFINEIHETDYEKLLHDLDWFNFSNNEFIKAEPLIRNEYKQVSDEEFYKARLEFYEKCIEHYGIHLYESKVFEKYNRIAYENIKNRINELKQYVS